MKLRGDGHRRRTRIGASRSRRIEAARWSSEVDEIRIGSVAETDYNLEALETRRRGRPSMGSGPAEVVPVRIDPELRAAIEARAEAEHTTTSEIIREAIRRFLEVA